MSCIFCVRSVADARGLGLSNGIRCGLSFFFATTLHDHCIQRTVPLSDRRSRLTM